MIHEEHRVQISLYVDGELDESAEQQVFEHLGECEECRGFLRRSIKLRADMTSEFLKDAFRPQVSVLMTESHEQRGPAFLRDRQPHHGMVRQGRKRRTMAGVFLFLLTIFLFGLVISSKVDMPEPPTRLNSSIIAQ